MIPESAGSSARDGKHSTLPGSQSARIKPVVGDTALFQSILEIRGATAMAFCTEDLTKRYEMADVLKDFDPDDLTFDVNLDFDDGFIGLDGADKSITMRLILAS